MVQDIRSFCRKALIGGVVLSVFGLPHPALAYTQCTVTLHDIFSGDDGYIWLAYAGGGSGYLSPNDPDKQATLAMATTALVSGRQLVVRYAADGVSCTASGRSDLIGVYLL